VIKGDLRRRVPVRTADIYLCVRSDKLASCICTPFLSKSNVISILPHPHTDESASVPLCCGVIQTEEHVSVHNKAQKSTWF